MAFALPPLPFDRAALEPVLSAESFDYHHGKHHKAYIDKVNGWIDEKGLAGKSLVEVIDIAKGSSDKPLANNAGQIWNHDFFWQCLAPAGSTKPSGDLARLIETAFGDHDTLVEKLAAEAVGHFGSGWAWLVLAGDALKIMSLHDGETRWAWRTSSRCSPSMCGSTLIISTIATNARASPRPCWAR